MVAQTGDERFVYDSYRRLVQMFGAVVLRVPDEPYEDVISDVKKQRGVKLDVELTADDWKKITERFKGLVKAYTGEDFPQDPYRQLELATRAVFDSWFGKRLPTIATPPASPRPGHSRQHSDGRLWQHG